MEWSKDLTLLLCISKWYLDRVRCQQKVKRVPGPQLDLQLNPDLQGLGRLRKNAVRNEIVEQVPPVLNVTRDVYRGLQLVCHYRLIGARVEPDYMRREPHRLGVGIPHTVLDLNAHPSLRLGCFARPGPVGRARLRFNGRFFRFRGLPEPLHFHVDFH